MCYDFDMEITTSIKKIEVGKFYLIHDGSKTGHPGIVVWKDDLCNLYLIIKFGSTNNIDNVPLKHPISTNVNKSYVYKRPLLCKRRDIGKELIVDMAINEEDITFVMSIQFNNFACSSSINRKDKRHFNRLKK